MLETYRNPTRMDLFTQKIINKYITHLIEFKGLEGLFPKINGKQFKEIISHWRKFPYYRLTNVLIDLRILPNQAGHWYYTDEIVWMSKYNIIPGKSLWKYLFQ